MEAQTEIEHYLSSMLDFLPSHYSSKRVYVCMWYRKQDGHKFSSGRHPNLATAKFNNRFLPPPANEQMTII